MTENKCITDCKYKDNCPNWPLPEPCEDYEE